MTVTQIAQELRCEAATLRRVLQKRGRDRVYRHHAFLQQAMKAACTAQCLAGALTTADGACPKVRLVLMFIRAHRRCQSAASAAAEEAAAARVDTAALTFAVIASLSRMGCLVAQGAVRVMGEEWCSRRWGEAYVRAVGQVGCRRLSGKDQARSRRRHEKRAQEDGDSGGAHVGRRPSPGHQPRHSLDGTGSLGDLLDAFSPSHPTLQ